MPILQLNRALVWWVSSLTLMLQVIPLCEAQTPSTPAKAASIEQRESIVDQTAEPFIHDSCHVGLSVAIVRGPKQWFYNFGSISRRTHTKPTADSVYEIASLTKTFTGALAAVALLEHRMLLDADFREYLPGEYPELELQGRPITLRSLATHTSGLPRDLPDTDDLYAQHDPERLPYQLIARESGYDRERYLVELHQVSLRSLPGAKEN